MNGDSCQSIDYTQWNFISMEEREVNRRKKQQKMTKRKFENKQLPFSRGIVADFERRTVANYS